MWGPHSESLPAEPPVRLLCRSNYSPCVCAPFPGAAPNPGALPGHTEPALLPTPPTPRLETNTSRAPGPMGLQLTPKVAPTPVRLHLPQEGCGYPHGLASCPQKSTSTPVRLHPPPIRPHLPLQGCSFTNRVAIRLHRPLQSCTDPHKDAPTSLRLH